MKRQGVIHQPLSNALAGLGHGDYFLLCDAGFPIPNDVDRIDLALTFGIPSMRQCVKAILDEIIVQKITVAEEMKEWNTVGHDFIYSTFQTQEIKEIPQEDLVKLAGKAKFIVRSGEIGCYSNVLLEAASGVAQFKENFIINMKEE